MSRILIQDGTTLIEHVLLAASTTARMRGLLGRAALPTDTGMLIRPCRSIHMWFMQFPIDAAFLDTDLQVLKVCRNLKPWQLGIAPAHTASVLETASGVLAMVQVGDHLTLQ